MSEASDQAWRLKKEKKKGTPFSENPHPRSPRPNNRRPRDRPPNDCDQDNCDRMEARVREARGPEARVQEASMSEASDQARIMSLETGDGQKFASKFDGCFWKTSRRCKNPLTPAFNVDEHRPLDLGRFSRQKFASGSAGKPTTLKVGVGGGARHVPSFAAVTEPLLRDYVFLFTGKLLSVTSSPKEVHAFEEHMERSYIHTYIHKCIHIYIHTYMHAYTHSYMRTSIRTYIPACAHWHTCNQTYTHTNIHASMYSCMRTTMVLRLHELLGSLWGHLGITSGSS